MNASFQSLGFPGNTQPRRGPRASSWSIRSGWHLLAFALLTILFPTGLRAAEFKGVYVLQFPGDLPKDPWGPLRIRIPFPAPFDGLPAVGVRFDSELFETPPSITKLSRDEVEVEVSLQASPELDDATPANGDREFAVDTTAGVIAGRLALVELKVTGDLFIHSKGTHGDEASWEIHAVDLAPLNLRDEYVCAASLWNGRLVVLSTGEGGLLLHQASGPMGEAPWSTERVSQDPVSTSAAFIGEIRGELALTIATYQRDAVGTNDLAEVLLWTQQGSGPSRWTNSFLKSVVLPRLSHASAGVIATRVGVLGGEPFVSVGRFSDSVSFLGCLQDACFWDRSSLGRTVWLFPGRSDLDRTGNGFGVSDSLWIGDRPVVVSRIGPGNSGGSFSSPMTLSFPKAWVYPKSVVWEASKEPRLRAKSLGNGMLLSGFGVPTLPEGPQRTYRLLRTESLTRPLWTVEETLTAGGDGLLSFHPPSVQSGTEFYRLEEIVP